MQIEVEIKSSYHGNNVFKFRRFCVRGGAVLWSPVADSWRLFCLHIVNEGADLYQMVTTAVDLLSTTHKFRRGDQARYLVPDVRASPSWTGSALSNAGIGQVNSEDFTNMAGENRQLLHWVPTVPATVPPTGALVAEQNFEVIDWAQSFQNAVDAGTPIDDVHKQASLNYYQNYGTDPADAQAKEHRDVLDAVSGTRNLHQKPISLVPATTPPPPPADPHWTCPSCCVVQ